VNTSPPFVVFSDDWGRHPSSCQHLIRQLLPRHEVYWVNTVGTRPPRFDLYTLRRGAGKFAECLTSCRTDDAGEPSPTILKPLMWPSFRGRLARQFNRRLLVNHIAKRLGGREAVFVTTVPVVADLVGALPAKRWVYYCVDDFASWPGLDGKTLQILEADLVATVDRVISASDALLRRLQELGRDSTVLTHGVDSAFWNHSNGHESPLLNGSEQPIVLFWGLIDQRLNAEWLLRLSDAMPNGTIALVGPHQDFDARLTRLHRVRFLGQVSFSDLPKLARCAKVLIMPYADLPVTRAMQPLKFKEYLATGKPVVAARLPATMEWNDAADLVSTADEFVAAVHRRISIGPDQSQLAARQRLAEESWAAKARVFERLCLEDAP